MQYYIAPGDETDKLLTKTTDGVSEGNRDAIMADVVWAAPTGH